MAGHGGGRALDGAGRCGRLSHRQRRAMRGRDETPGNSAKEQRAHHQTDQHDAPAHHLARNSPGDARTYIAAYQHGGQHDRHPAPLHGASGGVDAHGEQGEHGGDGVFQCVHAVEMGLADQGEHRQQQHAEAAVEVAAVHADHEQADQRLQPRRMLLGVAADAAQQGRPEGEQGGGEQQQPRH